MKRVLYFILAIITIAYMGILIYGNIALNVPEWIVYIQRYGGLAIALVYAAINFFGSPLKIVFLILLILAAVLLVLSIVIPDVFRGIFGLVAA